jgi:hypothetical protein
MKLAFAAGLVPLVLAICLIDLSPAPGIERAAQPLTVRRRVDAQSGSNASRRQLRTTEFRGRSRMLAEHWAQTPPKEAGERRQELSSAAALSATSLEPRLATDDDSVAQAKLLSTWSSETDDEDWTSDVRTFLTTAFSDLRNPGQVADVTCRTTICRAVLGFPTLADAADFGESTPNSVHPRRVFVRARSDRVEVEVFLSRADAAGSSL